MKTDVGEGNRPSPAHLARTDYETAGGRVADAVSASFQ
jgi:hypothetical protein